MLSALSLVSKIQNLETGQGRVGRGPKVVGVREGEN